MKSTEIRGTQCKVAAIVQCKKHHGNLDSCTRSAAAAECSLPPASAPFFCALSSMVCNSTQHRAAGGIRGNHSTRRMHAFCCIQLRQTHHAWQHETGHQFSLTQVAAAGCCSILLAASQQSCDWHPAFVHAHPNPDGLILAPKILRNIHTLIDQALTGCAPTMSSGGITALTVSSTASSRDSAVWQRTRWLRMFRMCGPASMIGYRMQQAAGGDNKHAEQQQQHGEHREQTW